jgi:hypothetical protein
MRRALISLLAALPLACAPATALAANGGKAPHGPCVAVSGTVVSVNVANNEFVANAYVLPVSAGNHCPVVTPTGPILTASDSPTPPTTTHVTVSTDANTQYTINNRPGSLSGLVPNSHFDGVFPGVPTDDINTVVSRPAVSIVAKTPPRHRQLFAWVGTVSGVNASARTVTVSVTRSLPASVIPSGSDPITFTVDRHTLILGGIGSGLSGGGLKGVQVGDVVAGGAIGWSDMTLTQAQALPLRLLLDFPAPTSGPLLTVRDKEFRQALALLGMKSGKPAHHNSKTKSHRKARHVVHVRKSRVRAHV